MLLILKDKKISVSGAEKTVKILKKKLEKMGIPTDIASFEEIEIFIEKNSVKAFIKNKSLEKYSTIFLRRVGNNRNLAFILSNIAKKNNLLCIDNLYQNTNEASKLKQTAILALENVSVPKTYFSSIYTKKSIANAQKFLGLPMVIKTSKSKKGLGVFLAKTKKEVLEIITKNPQGEIIIQEFIPNDFDYRILVLGNSIGCAIKRERPDKKNEFRNNVYLGATERFLDLSRVSSTLRKTALQAAKIANIQVAGVDIVINPTGQPYVFEVNRSPAFTYDEKISNELSSLAEYLKQCEKKKRKL